MMKKTTFTMTPLSIGAVRIYDLDGIRLHAYETKNPFADECYLFETGQELIGLEAPLFRDNLAEFADHIQSLNKPLNHLILAYHPGGGNAFADSRVYTTEAAKKSMGEGGFIKAMIANFAEGFGDILYTEIPAVTDTIKAGKVTIGGVEFIVTDTPESFDLEIPAINVVYTHMVGHRVHNILESPEHIDAMIEQMEDYEKRKPSLILTTHDVPVTAEIAAEKLSYLQKVKELAAKSKDQASFISGVKAAFPDYAGEKYLEMSAEVLF
ncbi:hypothetical protein AGMMS49944_23510 [Spirochaetia bacterium]|nr:hypothetical protein AGMMS49944_23510 [Spirochaetia bacterium]